MLTLKVVLPNVNDAAFLCEKCGEYEEDIDYQCGRYMIDAKSFMGVLSIGLGRECLITLHSDDEETQKRFMADMDLWWVYDEENA